jgi:drug/metabolite transporter (DMT)-like permease
MVLYVDFEADPLHRNQSVSLSINSRPNNSNRVSPMQRKPSAMPS